MHRASRFRSRSMFVYLVPLAVVLILGLIFIGSGLGRSGSDAELSFASAPDVASTGVDGASASTEPTVEAVAATGAPTTTKATVANLGVVKGMFTLKSPATATTGSLVAVVRQGPKQVLTKTVAAPGSVTLNSRTVPNGAYTVTLTWVRSGKSTVVSTSAIQVKNPKKAAATSTPTATTSSAPATSAPATTKPAPSTTTSAPASTGGFAGQVLALANAARKDNGCNTPLKLNSKLNAAAQGHSDDLVAKNFFSHTGSNGSDPFQRITAAGYKFSGAAENIAAGGTTAAGAMNQWMNSPGHKANILNCGLVDLGVGFTKGVNDDYAGYWVQDFGSPL